MRYFDWMNVYFVLFFVKGHHSVRGKKGKTFEFGDELCIYSTSQQRLRYIVQLTNGTKVTSPFSPIAPITTEKSLNILPLPPVPPLISSSSFEESKSEISETIKYVNTKKEKEKVHEIEKRNGTMFLIFMIFIFVFICVSFYILEKRREEKRKERIFLSIVWINFFQ